jgi:hypothetical protein
VVLERTKRKPSTPPEHEKSKKKYIKPPQLDHLNYKFSSDLYTEVQIKAQKIVRTPIGVVKKIQGKIDDHTE